MTWYEWYFYWGAGWLSFYTALTILIFVGMVARTWYMRWAHPPIVVEPEPELQMQPLQISFPEKQFVPTPHPQITQGPIWIGPQPTVPIQQPWAGGYSPLSGGNYFSDSLFRHLGGLTAPYSTSYADLHNGPYASSATQ